MFNFDKQLSPSPIKKKKLLLQISRDRVVTRLDEEVPGIVHVHVLLHPVGEISEEVLQEERKRKRFYLWFGGRKKNLPIAHSTTDFSSKEQI